MTLYINKDVQYNTILRTSIELHPGRGQVQRHFKPKCIRQETYVQRKAIFVIKRSVS